MLSVPLTRDLLVAKSDEAVEPGLHSCIRMQLFSISSRELISSSHNPHQQPQDKRMTCS
ncbi:hypothetical protein GCAAIG_00430 [Candidatus Electronema halotolerans]